MSSSIVLPKAVVIRKNFDENDFDHSSKKSKENCVKKFYKEADAKYQKEMIVRGKKFRIAWGIPFGIAGAVIGGIFGGLILQNPITIIGGCAIGSCGGTALGLKIGQKHHEITILKSKVYNSWKNAFLDKKVHEYFVNFIQSKVEFATILCPLSGNLPTITLRAPCGHIYDANALGEFLLERHAEIDQEISELRKRNLPDDEFQQEATHIRNSCCQYHCGYFTLNQCTIDQIRLKKIHDLIKAMMNSPSSYNDDQLIKSGLVALQMDIHSHHQIIIGEQTKDIVQQMIQRDIQPDDASLIFKEVYRQEKWNCSTCSSHEQDVQKYLELQKKKPQLISEPPKIHQPVEISNEESDEIESIKQESDGEEDPIAEEQEEQQEENIVEQEKEMVKVPTEKKQKVEENTAKILSPIPNPIEPAMLDRIREKLKASTPKLEPLKIEESLSKIEKVKSEDDEESDVTDLSDFESVSADSNENVK